MTNEQRDDERDHTTTQEIVTAVVRYAPITQAALEHELSQMERVMNARLDIFVARLNAIDKATELFEHNLSSVPTDVDKQIAHLSSLNDARLESVFQQLLVRFDGVSKQFEERDIRTAQASLADKTAIAAALQAQKEAVSEQAKSFTLGIDKADANTAKQIEAVVRTLDTIRVNLEGQLADVKDRTTRIESRGLGAMEQKTDSRDSHQQNSMLISGVIGIGLFGLAILEVILRLSGH